MTKKSSAWMPFYVGDYLADTMHLTTVQHGAYFLLICHYWRTGPIIDDDGVLASICRMGKSEWSKNSAIIRRFFTVRDGVLHQKRIDAELEFASGISEKRRAAANASWANRESKPHANASANAADVHLQNGMQNGARAYMRDARQSQSQSQSESQREESPPNPQGGTRAKKPPDCEIEFARFWEAYPRKAAKPDALKAFKAVVQTTPVDAILAGLGRFEFRDDPQFIPLPATWLRKERWNDLPPDKPKSKPSLWDRFENPGVDYDPNTIDVELDREQ